MTVSQTKHASQVVNRFRQMLTEAGDSLSDEHYQELSLLIEAALDVVAFEQLEACANKLEQLAHSVRRDESFFTPS